MTRRQRNPNLQQLPGVTPDAKRIKAAFSEAPATPKPEPGWEVKMVRPDEPYRYLLIVMDDSGNHHPCGHERFNSELQAVARAKWLASQGQRCDVLVDVAGSFGTNRD